MTNSNYKGTSRAMLVKMLNVANGRIKDLERINELQRERTDWLEAELKLRPIPEPHEKMMMLYMRNGQGRDLSQGLQYLINSLFFTDRPLDPEQREWLVPIVEITETLRLVNG